MFMKLKWKLTIIMGMVLGLFSLALGLVLHTKMSTVLEDKIAEELEVPQRTFPHQLFRVMLLKQIYRGFRINSAESYHK